MRIPIIAGNWKMNKTIKESLEYVDKFKELLKDTDIEVVICTPFTQLYSVKEALKGTNIKLAAQNMHWEANGAFTGEISPMMLKEIDVDYCIIGHSERREYFNETDENVNKKVLKALESGIKPIVCVGETLDERDQNKTKDKIKNQVIKALQNVKNEDIAYIVFAYEPIWAIGTGKTATPQEANEVISYIREIIKELYNEEISEQVRIQYGGSVKPNNATEIMNQEDIDGALVGGASLKPEDFIEIVNF